MAKTTVWKLTWTGKGAQQLLFTRRGLAVESVRLSYSTLPNVKIHDEGDKVLAEWTDPDGSGVYQHWFSLELIVDGEVLDRVEHL
jgi:hypothetical protein